MLKNRQFRQTTKEKGNSPVKTTTMEEEIKTGSQTGRNEATTEIEGETTRSTRRKEEKMKK